MKYASLLLALIVAFAAVTTPTLYHLGPAGIFLCKVGYNVLSLVFWLGLFFLLWKYWRAEHKMVSGVFSFAGRWIAATILTPPLVFLTFRVKLFAYGPYWSCPDRPMFAFGWPIPWKWETAGGPDFLLGALALDAMCCFCFLLFLFGFRKLKHFLIALLAPLLVLIGYLIIDGTADDLYDILTTRRLRPAAEATQVQ